MIYHSHLQRTATQSYVHSCLVGAFVLCLVKAATSALQTTSKATTCDLMPTCSQASDSVAVQMMSLKHPTCTFSGGKLAVHMLLIGLCQATIS